MPQPPVNPEDIASAFIDYRKRVADLRNEINKAYAGYLIKNIEQRRELFKYIATISLGILGLSSFVIQDSRYLNYTIGALVLHAIIIFLVVLYLRELLDKEGLDLQSQQDTYNEGSEKALETVDAYINQKWFTIEKWNTFWQEINDSATAKKIKQDNEDLKQARKTRNENLDYFGEFIVFLLISATLLMIMGALGSVIPFYELSLFIAFIFILSFSNSALLISKIISRVVAFLKKKRLIKKNT